MTISQIVAVLEYRITRCSNDISFGWAKGKGRWITQGELNAYKDALEMLMEVTKDEEDEEDE